MTTSHWPVDLTNRNTFGAFMLRARQLDVKNERKAQS